MKKVKIECDYYQDLPKIHISLNDEATLISEQIEKHLKNLNSRAYQVESLLEVLRWGETKECVEEHLGTIKDYQELLEQILTYLVNEPDVKYRHILFKETR